MKPTNLNPLFIDLLPEFANTITEQAQTKEQFLAAVKQRPDAGTSKNVLFYQGAIRSDFDTIRLDVEKNEVLFNH